jgi:CarD family transcriptional regulator
MFQIHDVVVYGAQGVCEIIGVQAQQIGAESKAYFVLKPKNHPEATFYVPTWNEKALAKMRKVMTKEAVDDLIDSMPDKTPIWIENEKERKEIYKNILTGGDHAAVISMIQALYLRKKEREAAGKRRHMSDEHFMKEAEQLLYHEWQYVLNLDKAGLMDYIFARLDQNP